MKGMRRLLRRNAAKAFIVVLLVIQIMPLAQACPLAQINVSMAFATAEMPEPCAGMPKQACLLNYIQSDQAWRGDAPCIAAHCPAAMHVTPFGSPPLLSAGGEPSEWSVRSGEPPPRVLFCRLLE